MNGFLYDAKSQGIGTRMNADRCTDLIKLDLLLEIQTCCLQRLIGTLAEGLALFDVISKANTYGEFIRGKALLLQVLNEKFDRLLRRPLSATTDAGRKNLTLL